MIQSELRMLAASFLFGVGIIVSYGLIDLVRQFVLLSKPMRVITELLYWSVAAVVAFQLQFWLNDGILRMYSVAGAAVGLIFAHMLTTAVFSYLTRKAKKAGRKRRIRCRKRRIMLQNQLKKCWKQVKINLNSLRVQQEEKES